MTPTSPETMACPSCGGRGADDEGYCASCNGGGVVLREPTPTSPEGSAAESAESVLVETYMASIGNAHSVDELAASLVAALLAAVPEGPGVVILRGGTLRGLSRLQHHDWHTNVNDGEGGTKPEVWASYSLDPPEVVTPQPPDAEEKTDG